jgi:hypothetical protein
MFYINHPDARRFSRIVIIGMPISLIYLNYLQVGKGLSVPGHALRCGPETSVTSPLRGRSLEFRGHEKTYIQSSRPWECGNPEGISKECGKGGKPASWLSMLSRLCRFHGLLSASRFKTSRPPPSAMRRTRFCTLIGDLVNKCTGDLATNDETHHIVQLCDRRYRHKPDCA